MINSYVLAFLSVGLVVAAVAIFSFAGQDYFQGGSTSQTDQERADPSAGTSSIR